jgi:hypothetical protein
MGESLYKCMIIFATHVNRITWSVGNHGIRSRGPVRTILARCCPPIESADVLQGQFNKFLNESSFLILHEVGFAGNVKDAKAMKTKTTGSRATTNEKDANIGIIIEYQVKGRSLAATVWVATM